MRIRHISCITAIALLLVFPALAQPDTGAGGVKTFGNELLNVTVPDGWAASEARGEVEESLRLYDDQICAAPIELVPEDGGAGFMIVASGRDDTLGTFFDYIVLLRSKDLEIVQLYSGETELVGKDGGGYRTRVTINALDVGDSELTICHDFILFRDDVRYEFAYISPVETYAANYDGVEEIMGGLEFR